MRPAHRTQESFYPPGALGDGDPPALRQHDAALRGARHWRRTLGVCDVQRGDPDGEIVGTSGNHARLEPGSALIYGNEVSLTLLIDERGHVQDYYLSGGELTDEMKSLILLSQFTPATASGQPTWGLKQIVFNPGRHLRS